MIGLQAVAGGAAGPGSVPERRRGLKGLMLGASSLVALCAAPATAAPQTPALPQGGAFAAGSGVISTSGGTVSISQASARGVIDWRSFSIGAGGRVSIDNGAGATLNRVLGGDLSRIDGALTATGSVYLINPAGVVVGPGGRVLTGGSFTASTRDIADDAFMAGGPMTAFGRSAGDVSNAGSILARDGDVVLIGRSVENTGDIAAPKGAATLAAADRVLMTTVGGPSGVYVAPDAGSTGSVTHTGRIAAAAAALKAAGGDVYTLAGNRSGLISATGVSAVGGQVLLSAPDGQVVAGGTVTAKAADGSGGSIVVNGARTTVAAGAVLDATGVRGGQVLVGVSTPGGGDLAASTTVADGATLLSGGPSGGGLVETSGHAVSIGRATVLAGAGGAWSVDPFDLTIDSAAAATIGSALNAGTNVTEQTTATTTSGAGSVAPGAGDIVVAAPISWTGTGALTLQAYHDLKINAAIAGGGALSGTAGGAVSVSAGVSAASVLLSAAGGSLTLASGASVAGATGVTLGTTGGFVNNAGAGALSGGTGSWLVYSANPANDTVGGLSPAFYQYAASFGANGAGATAPARSGNGLLYSLAPSVGVTLSGSAARPYDGTTALTFTGANASVSGLVNADAATVTGVYASKNVGSGLTVTANSVAVSHGGTPVYGYAGLSPSVSAAIGQITPATLTAAIVGAPTKTYNGTTTATLTAVNYQVTGFAAGEGATVNQPSSVAYDSAAAGARTVNATFVATNFVANSGTLLSNYTLPTSASGAGTILQAPLLVTGVLATDKTYDRTTTDALNTGAAALYGVIGADAVSLVTAGAAGAFASANAGSSLAVTASGFSLSGAASANYALVQPGGLTASISPASLTVGGVAALGKVYDGATTATLSLGGASLSGVIAGDTVTLGTSSATGAFATADVGTAKAVTAAGFTIAGSAASNYRLSQPAGLTADVTKKALSVAVTATPAKVYDGTTTAVVDSSGFSLTGFVAGESGSVGQTSHVNYATANAGTQAVTATLAVSDYLAGANTRLSNYALPTTAAGTGAITAAPLTIQLVGDPTKTYDGTTAATLGASNFTLTGFLAGEGAAVTQTSGTYAVKDAGVRLVTATLSAADFTPAGGTRLGNYQLPTLATGYGTITPAQLAGSVYAAITGNPTKSYDGTTVATLTSTDFTLSGFAPGEGATVTQTIGAYADKNAGVKPVTASLAASDFTANGGTTLSNYTLPTTAYGSGTITPATLTALVTGTPTKVYNATTVAVLDPASIGFSGLASGESVTVSGAPNAAYDSSQAGSRNVTANFATTNLVAGSGTLLANYVLPTSATGAGLITQAPLSILNVAALSKTYDTTTAATLSTGAAALFGVVGLDAVALSSSGASASFAGASAGSHVAVSASGFALTGGDSANYQLFQPTGLFAAINRAPVTITGVSALDKAYDATNAAALSTGSAGLLGVYGSDAANVALNAGAATATFASVNVGSNLQVSAGGFALTGSSASNYALSQPSGLRASITPAILSALIVGDPTKVYDGSTSVTLTGSNYQLVGFVAGQGASVPQSATAHYVSADAGARGITSSLVSSDFRANAGTNLANYQLPTTGTGTGTITQAPLTAAITGTPTKTYDSTTGATLAPANYVLKGFIGAQSASVTQTGGTYASANAGSQGVTAVLAGSDYTAGAGTTLANYLLPTSASGLGKINKATLTVTGVAGVSRVYDGTYADTLNVAGAGVSGLFGSDTVTLNTGGASGLFASKDVGAGIGVTASGFTISGGRSANYTLAQPTGLSADISQATLTLTRVQRTYDATTGLPTNQTSFWLGGIVAADNGNVVVDASNLTGAYASRNVGSATAVSVSGLALTGSRAANYTIASSYTNALIGYINPAALTVTGVTVQNRTYDATATATLLNGSAALAGVLASDVVTLSAVPTTGLFSSKNVGVRSVTASGYAIGGTDAGNYVLSQPTGLSGVISPASVTVATVTKTYDASTTITRTGTGTVNASTLTLSGVFGAETVSVASGVSGTFASKDAGSGLNVSLSGLSLTGSSASNYQIAATQSGALGTITKRALGVAFTGTPTKVYDAGAAATLTPANFVVSGWASGEGGAITRTAGTYASADAGSRGVTTTVAAGDYSANAGTLLSNYTLATPTLNGAGLITPAPLTILGVLATTKTYDGSTADPLSVGGAALQGLQGGDASAVTLSTAGATGAFASAGVGAGKPVTASGFTISGAKAGNYLLSQPTGLAADILQAVLQVASVTKVYDGTTAAYGAGVSYTLSGISGSDAVSLNTAGLTGTYVAKDVGSSLSVSLSGLTLTGAQAANYAIGSSLSGAAIGLITPATLTLVGASAVGKAYDGTTAAAVSDASAFLSGLKGADVVGFTGPGAGVFASANVGTRAVTLSGSYALSGMDARDYVLVQPTGFSAAITPAPLTAAITGGPTRTYDGGVAAALTSGMYTLTGFVSGQGATVTRTAGVYDSADAGARTVSTTLSAGDFTAGGGTLLSNYALPAVASGVGTITQRSLTGSIVGLPQKSYDGGVAATLASVNFTLAGFVGGQGATVTATHGTYASADAGTSLVTALLSAADFTGTGATNLSNYVLPTSLSGAGRIDPRLLTAAITGAPGKTYDATTAATLAPGDYTLSGFVAGQGASVSPTSGTYDGADAGARTVSTTLSAGDFTASGATNLANYVLPTTASGAGTIARKTLTAQLVGSPTKTYDGGAVAALSGANVQLSGFVGAQGAGVAVTGGVYDSADAGARTVSATLAAGDFTATGGANLSNYLLPTSASGAGAILRKALGVSITGAPTRVYDGTTAATLTAADFTLTGFTAGQGASVLQTTGLYAGADAGAQGVSVLLSAGDFAAQGGANLANYVLPTSASGMGAITRRSLTARVTGDPTRTYDGGAAATLTAADYTLAGFVAGQGATVTQAAGLYDAADAGTRTVTAGLGASDFAAGAGTNLANYLLPTTASGAGRIDRRALAVAITGAPMKIYDATIGATLAAGDYALIGFVAGQGATVTQGLGAYASADAGVRAVTASLGSGDFTAAAGTDLSNYVLPTLASGTGRIDPRTLFAAITGDPAKTYDATTVATLAAGDYALTGFVAGQGARVTRTAGTYDGADAGARSVSATLSAGDFTATGGANFANYVLPTTASGAGTITPRTLTATLVGAPTKTYDGATDAVLAPANFALSGFAGGQTAVVVATAGAYDAADAGARTVSAVLDASDFVGGAGVNLANYALPTAATGAGAITPRALAATLTGTPRKAYDGSTLAVLTAADFTLFGFVAGQGATVTQGAGTYAGASAGAHAVAVTLSAGDFAAAAGTRLSNYQLPTSASGGGVIDRALLTAAITGAPTKIYDGTTAAALVAGDFTLTGFARGEGAQVTQGVGVYAGADAGARSVSASLSAGDFAALTGVDLSNYVLPTSATGVGAITPRMLTAAITGAPTKTYDGETSATLLSADYALTGFVAGQGATVTQTRGAYDGADAGRRGVVATLSAGDFAAGAGTLLGNYVLPTAAAGVGAITPRALTATLTGDPSRMADGTTAAALGAANFVVSGFVAGQGATVTQTLGAYDAPDAGARTVTAALGPGDFAASGGTRLANYLLPSQASGAGAITPAVITAAPTFAQAVSANLLVRDLASPAQISLAAELAAFAAATPRSYIPYPAPSALSTWMNNGFGSLPSVLQSDDGGEAADEGAAVRSGPPVINSTEQILLQGGKDKAWRIAPPIAPPVTLSSLSPPPPVVLTAR